jgi:aminobenzoyl-glutamate transport protein
LSFILQKKLLLRLLFFTGILSHLASEAGYVILIPLGALIFHTLGRHPMAGLAAAFCGVSGGFGANLLIVFCGSDFIWALSICGPNC